MDRKREDSFAMDKTNPINTTVDVYSHNTELLMKIVELLEAILESSSYNGAILSQIDDSTP